jgi:amino acid adenylation domain-containing protein
MLRRSTDLPIALLAILQSGAAYVPLDQTHPPARRRAILADAGVRLLLTDTDPGADCPDGVTILRLDDLDLTTQPTTLPAPTATAEQPAYVIYTSGSTGTPKGVEIPHAALANLLASMALEPGCTETDRLLAVTTIAFDIAGLELFLPLTTGAELVIATSDQSRDGTALARLIADHRITLLQATPSLWRILLEAGFRGAPGFRLLAGGEPLDRALANRLLDGGGALWNLYGPTETTIWSAIAPIPQGDAPISIGHPIAATGLHILDPDGEPRPDGVPGELVITGAGLALGYLGAPALTETACPTLTIAGHPQRAYRTGDIAKRLPDGTLLLLGRRDSQVKLRGYRIELGEIDSALAHIQGITAAAVMLRTDIGGGQLTGYYVASDPAPTPADLTHALAQRLPDYMIPTLWVQLPALPLTPNGKTDRAALPAPNATARHQTRPHTPPRTPDEQRIADVWRAVLGLDQVSVTDTLFTLGADSIHLFRIAARLMRDGIALTASDLLAHPTIAEQAIFAAGKTLTPRPSLTDYVRARRAAAQPA